MQPRPSLLAGKRLQARERTVRAAEELFVKRGFDAVSVTDIADRAEVGRTTFFRHFGDKQEVVFAVEQELMATIEAAHRSRTTPTPRDPVEAVEQVRDVVLALCEQAAADPASYQRHFDFVEQHPELRARDALKMQAFADRLTNLLLGRSYDPQPRRSPARSHWPATGQRDEPGTTPPHWSKTPAPPSTASSHSAPTIGLHLRAARRVSVLCSLPVSVSLLT